MMKGADHVSSSQTRQFGDPVWEKLFGKENWGGSYPSEEAVRFIARAKKMLGPDRNWALDIGCGKGACAWMMAREGLRVSCIDGSPSAVESLSATFTRFKVTQKPEIILGDITRPDAHIKQGERFDIFLDHYSLYSNLLSDIKRAYKQYLRLARPGALLLTCCFGKSTTGFGTGTRLTSNSYHNIPQGPLAKRGTVTFFTQDELQDILCNTGYNLVYSEVITIAVKRERIEKIVIAARCP